MKREIEMTDHAHKKIHKLLKKHHPEAVKKAKRIFSFKYPKLAIFGILIILAYYLFSRPFVSEWIGSFDFGNWGIFISGALTSFGFTAPFGIGLLAKMNITNVLSATLIGGIGATVADLFIFKTIKLSFTDEFKMLEKTRVIKKIEGIVKKNKHVLIMHYLLYILAGIAIVTPIPDEIGVSMLAGLTTIKPVALAIISFVLHASAIFFIISVL